MPTAWMVRAGEGGYVIDDFEKKNCVAIGWEDLGDLSQVKSKEDLREQMDKAYPEWKPRRRQVSTTMVGRFVFDIRVGEPIVSYNTDTRQYLIGEVTGEYTYKPGHVQDHSHVRTVKWLGRVSRDDLSVESRNTLGAICTLFLLSEEVHAELKQLQEGKKPKAKTGSEDEEFEQLRLGVLGRSHEFIKDEVQKLSWEEMQELVAGILRAMGYRTHVSGKGSDRGKDIVASPDGLGLEQPRIRVEVKHRPKQQMGAPEVRSFIGALRQNDKGLYVSTGGFSKEANYEAERATVPVTLLDLDDVASLLVQHYEQVDTSTRTLVPLTRVYWPAP